MSELLIAEALHPYPAGLVIATKGGHTRPGPNIWVPDGRPEYLTQCVEKSLKRLKLERIDLYQLHRIDPKVPVEESLGALKKMQDAGKIRHVGLSEVTPKEIEQARKVLPIVSVQNQYNIANRQSEGTLAYCEKENLGFIPWAPIGGGRSSFAKGRTIRWKPKRNVAESVSCRLRWPGYSTIAGDAADPGNVVSRAPGGKHGLRETPTDSGRMEDDGRVGASVRLIVSAGASRLAPDNLV